MLRGEHRQLRPDHVPDLARPQAPGIDHMRGRDLAFAGDDAPLAIRAADDVLDLGEALDLGAESPRGLGIGLRDAGGIGMAVLAIARGADELLGVRQRHQLGPLARGDLLQVEPGMASLGDPRRAASPWAGALPPAARRR